MSQVLRQEGEHRRFALADSKNRKKELFFTPRKATVGCRSELPLLASLQQLMDAQPDDLEKLIRNAFRQVSRSGRLNKEDLPRALRHCRFKDVKEQWLEEIYEEITMTPFLGADEFETFVNEYASRQQGLYEEAFRKFDVDESDQISTEELQEVLRSLGHVVPPSLVTEIMEKVDYDGSGELSFDEFETLMKFLEDSDGFPQVEQDEHQMVFKRFSRDGKLELEAFASVLHWLGYPQGLQDFEDIIENAERDGRNALDYNEFIVVMKAVREIQLKRLSKVFEESDKDGNGTLNVAELETALRALRHEFDQQVVSEVVREVNEVRSQLRSSRLVDFTFEDVLDFMQRYRNREGLSNNDLEELGAAFRRYEYENSQAVRCRDAHRVMNWFGCEMEAAEAERIAARVDVDNSGNLSLADMKKVLRMEHEDSLKRYAQTFSKQDTGSGEINSQQAMKLFSELQLEAKDAANSFELGLLSAFRQGGGGYALDSFVRNCMKRKKSRIQEVRQTGGFSELKLNKLSQLFKESSTNQRFEQVINPTEVTRLCIEFFVLGVVEPLRASFAELLRDVERRPPATSVCFRLCFAMCCLCWSCWLLLPSFAPMWH